VPIEIFDDVQKVGKSQKQAVRLLDFGNHADHLVFKCVRIAVVRRMPPICRRFGTKGFNHSQVCKQGGMSSRQDNPTGTLFAWSSVTCGPRVPRTILLEGRSRMRNLWTAILLILGLALSANPGFARERGFSAYDRIDRSEGRGHVDDHAGARNSQGGKQRGAVSQGKKPSHANCGHSPGQARKQGCRDPFTRRRRTPRSLRRERQPASFQQPHSEVQVHGVPVR
jgi:hypothetical protein